MHPTPPRDEAFVTSPSPSSSLYARVLGAEAQRLAPALRRVHGRGRSFTARGVFAVRYGAGWWRRLLARLLGMPPAGEAVALRLRVDVKGDQEVWTRRFGPARLRSRQFARGGLLWEVMGPARFGMALSVEAGGALRFTTRRVRVLGLPAPRALAPRIGALAEGVTDTRWRVSVEVFLPLVGLLAAYAGEVALDAEAPGDGAGGP